MRAWWFGLTILILAIVVIVAVMLGLLPPQ